MDSIEKKRLERSMTGATPTEQKRSKTENRIAMREKMRHSGMFEYNSNPKVKRIRRTSSETSEEYDNDPRNYNGLFDQSEQFDSFRSPPKRSYRDNEEELMNLDVGESIIPKKRLLSSELDLWKPANLISNTCYDKSTGLLLSKEQCDENLKKTMKTKRGIDYYGILQSSSSNSSKTLAFLAYQINKIISKTDIRSKEERNTSSNLFDLEAAREISKNVFLPGGKKVIISMLIDHALCASWVGTNVLCKSVVSVLEEMKCRDPWFLVYSAPATHRSTSYVRLEPDFFSKFAETLSAGFGWPMDSKNLSNLIDKITGITRNFIDKKRGQVKEQCAILHKQFFTQFEEDNLFRVLEPPLHDDIRQNRYSQRKHLLDDDNLKNKDSDNYVENMEMETNILTNRSTHVDRQNDQNEAYDSCFEHNAIEASAPAKEPPPSIDDFSAEERVEFRLINNRCVQNEYSSDDDDIEDYSASFNTPKLKTNLLSSSSKNVDSRQDNKYESISGSSKLHTPVTKSSAGKPTLPAKVFSSKQNIECPKVKNNRYSQRKHLTRDNDLKDNNPDVHVNNMKSKEDVSNCNLARKDMHRVGQHKSINASSEQHTPVTKSPAGKPAPPAEGFSSQQNFECPKVKNTRYSQRKQNYDLKDNNPDVHVKNMKKETNLLTNSSKLIVQNSSSELQTPVTTSGAKKVLKTIQKTKNASETNGRTNRKKNVPIRFMD